MHADAFHRDPISFREPSRLIDRHGLLSAYMRLHYPHSIAVVVPIEGRYNTEEEEFQIEDRKESWPCGPPPRMKGLRLTAGWLLSTIALGREMADLFNGGAHPVRKVVWPRLERTSDWCFQARETN